MNYGSKTIFDSYVRIDYMERTDQSGLQQMEE